MSTEQSLREKIEIIVGEATNQWDDGVDHDTPAVNKLVALFIAEMKRIIGPDEEVESMEDYIESRGGLLNIEDDDNPEIEGIARNGLRDELRSKLSRLGGQNG